MIKKIFLTLFLISSFIGSTLAQNKTVFQLPEVDNIQSGDYLSMWDISNMTFNKITLGDFATSISSLLGDMGSYSSSLHTWSANQTYTSGLIMSTGGFLVLPSSLSGTNSRSVWIEDGLMYYYYNSSSVPLATRDWVTANFATSSGATDLSSVYMTLASPQTITGAKDINSIYDFTGGTLYLPYKASYTASAKDQSLFVYSDGTIRGTLKNSSNDAVDVTLATRDWVNTNFPVVTGYVQSSGSQSGITSTLTWSSGTINPYKIAFDTPSSSLIMPHANYGTHTKTAEEGSILFDTNGDNLYVYDGTSWDMFPNSANIQTMIDNNLGSEAPSAQTGTTDTVDFSNKNYSQGIYGIFYPVGETQNIVVSNYEPGWTTFYIYSGSYTNLVFADTDPLTEIKWTGGVEPPILDGSQDGKIYKVVLEYFNETTCLGSYTWFE